ncbi:MAG: hypothetical protein FJX54_22225 [Alphaproteobacteria bacterium]|nr:hypothetical protein [Alphaproteobacteria bacterium]
MTGKLDTTVPPLDPTQLAELAQFFEQFGDWFRSAMRDTEDAARVGGRRDEPQGIRAVSFFAAELDANVSDFTLAAARLLAMAEAGRPVVVRRVDFAGVSDTTGTAPGRPGLRLAVVNGEPAA